MRPPQRRRLRSLCAALRPTPTAAEVTTAVVDEVASVLRGLDASELL